MKVKSIKPIGKKEVFDIAVKDAEHYILENGVVTHNSGAVYSANVILTITRAQDKSQSTKEINGYTFTLCSDKSRFVKEGSKFPLYVSFEGGIDKWSGILELAMEFGMVSKTGQSHVRDFIENDKPICLFRSSKETVDEWYQSILDNPEFPEFVKKRFFVGGTAMLETQD